MSPTGLHRRLAVAALVAAAATGPACSSNDGRFTIHLVWQDEDNQSCRPQGQVAPTTCSDLPMTCGAWARIRIVDAEDPTLAYFSSCFRLQPGGDACKLGGLEIPTNSIPNRMVKIQVIVWADQELVPPWEPPEGEECPLTTAFTSDGLAQLLPDVPLPAIAGETYFPVGKQRYAEVVLGCPASGQLAACTDTSMQVIADVQDPRTLTTVTNPSMMQVGLGAPVRDTDQTWHVEPGELTPLDRTTIGVPGWTATLDAPPTDVTCIHALRLAAQTTPALTCFPPPAPDATEWRIAGFHADPPLVDGLLDSLLLGNFPPAGLVVGIVVDHLDAKVEGAQVSASRGADTYTVVYPEADFSGVRFDGTTSTGLFLSFNAPFDATWSVVSPSGLDGDGRARGGLVADTLSVVRIRLESPIGPAARAAPATPDGDASQLDEIVP